MALDSSETEGSDPLFEQHDGVPAAKHILKKKEKRVAPAPSGDSSKLPSDTVQDVKALATVLALRWKDSEEEKAIGADLAHAAALKVCTVEFVKCSSSARLNLFSFLQSLDQAQQRRLAVEDTRKQLWQRFGWAGNKPIPLVIVDGPDGESAVGLPGEATKWTPCPKKSEEMVFLPPQWEQVGGAAGTTWPVIAVKDSISFSNPHAAEQAFKQLRAAKQEAINEEGNKTMEEEVSEAPEAEADKDCDSRVPVPTPPVIPEPKDSEKNVPVPSPPEVSETKEGEEQVPVSAFPEVLTEEKAESAGPGVPLEHQKTGEDVPAAAPGQEKIEEVGEAPKEEERPACQQEN